MLSQGNLADSREFCGVRLIPDKTSRPESAQLSKILSNQQDSLEPARLSRISKIPSNRTDSLSDSRPPNPADIRPRLLRHRVTSPHSYPQPGTQPCRVICHRGTHRTFLGSWGITLWAQGHCLLTVVRCPVPSLVGLLVYGHRPFSLRPRGLFVYVFMPTGPISYACGLSLLYLGPSPFFID